MRKYQRRPWCVCFDGSKFAELIITDHAIYTDCRQRGLVKNVLFMCLGNVHLGIFILMVEKSCRPVGSSSQMSCWSYAKVVSLGPTGISNTSVIYRLLYKIHNELLQLAHQGHDTWAGHVENVIRKYTTDLPSHNAMPLDNKAVDALGNKLRELRYDQFICNWKMDLHQRDKLPKLDTYKIIKSDYRIEPHILYVRNKRYQRALTRLRVSSHKLNIEVGRHSRPYIPRHQRFCLYCDTGEIDNEIHFLLKCPFHSAGRFSLLQEIVHYLPLQSKPDHRDMFINIMTSKNQMILNALGKFVYEEFKRREIEPPSADC